MANFQIEREVIKQPYRHIAGVDEAGRGALFGPVVAGAVVFPSRFFRRASPEWLMEINDSKVLTAKKREKLAGIILREAKAVGIGLATSGEIDKKNIYWASLEAMERAVKRLQVTPDVLLIDGFRLKLKEVDCLQMSIPQGDRKSISIAAASILAKVFRDEMMSLCDAVFEGYALYRNKGYGTREHYRALREKGPTSFHRLSFNLTTRGGHEFKSR